jgi:chromosome segregation ATPase
MGEKYPRWTYVVIFALLAIVVVLAARALKSHDKVENAAPPPEQSARALADKDRQIQELNGEIAQLRKDVEENSGKVKEMESKLDRANKALAAAQQKWKASQQKQTERAAAPPAARERTAAKSVEAFPPPAARRVAAAGSYEIIRDTAVLERPSASAREVALVQRGTIINVVGSQGDWLEVRSRYEKPPGFIRRDDARLKQGENEGR